MSENEVADSLYGITECDVDFCININVAALSCQRIVVEKEKTTQLCKVSTDSTT